MAQEEWRTEHDELTSLGPTHLRWVESTWFQSSVAGVILLNSIIIGLETDIKTPAWWWVEQLLLSFFCFELCCRLMRFGFFDFFRHEEDWFWNLMDFGIVMSGVFDQWVSPGITLILESQDGGHRVSIVFMLLRMLRLLRIVRLFRLVRIVRPLFELAQGILEAVQGMFWVLVFMVMTLYAIAILCTRLIGHGPLLGGEDDIEDEDLQRIRAMFSSVPSSMFALFGSMSAWSLDKFNPLFEEVPILKPVFVLFYVYSAWALLAVMTGVVSNNMIAIREQMLTEDNQKEEMRRTQIQELLLEMFEKADEDNSGTISRQEFDLMCKSPDLMKKLVKNSYVRIQDLQDLFDWLDHDKGGTITVDEFMEGFKWVNEPLKAKSLVKLQERLAGDLQTLHSAFNVMEKARFSELGKVVWDPLRKVNAITEQMQNLDIHFLDLRGGLEEQMVDQPTIEELGAVESSLTLRMDRVLEMVDDLDRATNPDRSSELMMEDSHEFHRLITR